MPDLRPYVTDTHSLLCHLYDLPLLSPAALAKQWLTSAH